MKVKYRRPTAHAITLTVAYDLPEHMVSVARDWVEKGWLPGDFLEAVLKNNLMDAFARADAENTSSMLLWAQWLWDLPRMCRQLEEWEQAGGLFGEKHCFEVEEVFP